MSEDIDSLPVHPGLLDGRERDLLAILARATHPVTVEGATEALANYQDDTRRNRVLGHLDDLARGELVVETDHGWTITDGGRNALEHHVEWLVRGLDVQLVDEEHRLEGAEPSTVPDDAERDENGEAVFDPDEAAERLSGGDA